MDVTHNLATVRSELARADSKATTLLGLAGTAVSVALAAATLGAARLPTLAQAAIWGAVTLLAAAVAVLLLTVRPYLPRPGAEVGWIAYAYSSPEALAATPAADRERDQLTELIQLSQVARTKYARIRFAGDLLLGALAGGPLLFVTALIIAGGGS
ncbi:Pycsar system effector family protein [Streptosporangium sp. NPDC002721]|uniref:Pycsar system effector family protein n=1 Tax=Streptosporangium sp. NPDC002721 TaxID=3366188 RepID=UPI0036A63AFA